MRGPAWTPASLALLLLLIGTLEARPQTPGATRGPAVSLPAAPVSAALPSWDIGGSAGWRQKRVIAIGSGIGEWYDSAWLGGEVGRYWTEHLKTEAGFAVSPRDEMWSGSGEVVVIAGRSYWQSGVDYLRTRRLFVNQLYQFRHNTWVHPFIGAGVNLAWEEQGGMRHLYPIRGDALAREETIPAHTETRISGAALAGVKIYFSRRGFVRTDAVFGFAKRLDEVVLRVGAGMDF
jgi:hypothetical protein